LSALRPGDSVGLPTEEGAVATFFFRKGVRFYAALLVAAVVGVVLTAAGPAATTSWNYVAMGDSYSSGVGTGSYTLDSACKRSVYAYPYLFTQKHTMGSFAFVACSGAKTTDLIAKQLPSLNASTNLVTMTIGGNDIGFASLIQQCTLSNCTATLESTTANLKTTLGPALNTAFADVRSAAPNATVIVLGYPHVFSTASCFGTLGISSAEERDANALADALDSLISGYASTYHFTYESALGPWTGHAVCSSSAWLNGLNLLNTGESYHPNRAGHSAGYLPMVTAVTG
jgi:lysophospholipase L1-like esterase